MSKFVSKAVLMATGCVLLTHCGTSSMGTGNMGGPTAEARAANIAAEPRGDFYYGRRYYVEKTRFWGYLREPGQQASRSKLVIMREDKKHNPDRLSENGPAGQKYGYDNNFEYRIRGYYTGKQAYDPNSNQFLAEFMPTDFEVVDRQPGWLFRPDDRYNKLRVTLFSR